MAKDPAFLFYSKDWFTDTVEMGATERGVYINMMAYQHINGSLPVDEEDLNSIAVLKKRDGKFNKIWPKIKHKFVEKDNRFYNNKLVGVMGERALYSKKNKISGTFASLVRKTKYKQLIPKIKGKFFVDNFINIEDDKLKERITEWFNDTVNRLLKM